MKLFITVLKITLICSIFSGLAAQESSPIRTRPMEDVDGIKVEVLSIPTATTPTDGEPLMALLYYPEEGINPYGPGILMHHGGPGGHPARQVGAPRFAAERLAARGYTVLSIMSRHARNHHVRPFEESAFDIKAGLDFLEMRGMEDLILAGHSLGSIRITYYQTSTHDPRVKAHVHFAPTSDMYGELPLQFLPLDDLTKEASTAIGRGAGRPKDPLDPGRVKGLEPDVWIHLSEGDFYSPESFMSFWSPLAKTKNSDWFPHIDVAILMLAGSNDIMVPEGRLKFLAERATASPRVDYFRYEGANHFFEKFHDQSVEDMVNWLNDIGLGVRNRITIDVVDTQMVTGRHLPGILYMPESGPDMGKPAFLLMHGWTGDILHSSNHWLGWRLAQAGYVVLAPQTRTSSRQGIQRAKLNDVADDLGSWIDFMESRGFCKIIMEGHSAGGIWISNYMSVSDDPRVVGMVYLAPTRDMSTHARRGIGDDRYKEIVAEAEAAVARGEGRTHVINEMYYTADVPPEIGFRTTIVMLAEQFLEYWGPNARSIHTDRVREFDRPSLTIAGRLDGLMTEDFVRRFTRAHKGQTEAIWYEDGSHRLLESKNRVLDDIVNWTEKNFTP